MFICSGRFDFCLQPNDGWSNGYGDGERGKDRCLVVSASSAAAPVPSSAAAASATASSTAASPSSSREEEAQIPLGHRPCPHLLLPKPPAERCETSTFSLRRRRSHLPVLLPVHTTTKQHPSLRQRLG